MRKTANPQKMGARIRNNLQNFRVTELSDSPTCFGNPGEVELCFGRQAEGFLSSFVIKLRENPRFGVSDLKSTDENLLKENDETNRKVRCIV